MKSLSKQHIVIFDGVCNLCNSTVNFIIKHDKAGKIKFVPLQWAKAKMLVSNDESDLNNSVIYLHNGKVYKHSGAILRITRLLSFPYNLLNIFILIPPFIRNYFYKVVSRNRYKWFGKRDSCMIPENAYKERFLH